MIYGVDKAKVLGTSAVETRALGVTPVTKISGGAKTLILIYKEPDKVFNASTCGDNCAKWILEIAKKSKADVTVNLRHIMDFGIKPFEIRISNNGKVVHNMAKLVAEAIPLLHSQEGPETPASESQQEKTPAKEYDADQELSPDFTGRTLDPARWDVYLTVRDELESLLKGDSNILGIRSSDVPDPHDSCASITVAFSRSALFAGQMLRAFTRILEKAHSCQFTSSEDSVLMTVLVDGIRHE